MRRTDSSIATFASGEREPAALQAQQRRDRLQVVLHPVVDLADRGVLGQQQPVPAPQLGHVAGEHDRAGHRAVVDQRDAADEHGHVGLPLELLGDRRPRSRTPSRTRLSSRPSSPKRSPSVLACTPMRCSADTPFGDVYSTRPAASRRITPSPTRGASSVSASSRVEGEVAGRDHAGEAVEDVDVGALELAGLATERRRRLPGEHADHLAAAAHRDAQHPHPLLERGDGGLALDDLAEPERPGDERPLLLVDDRADPVGPVDGLGGGGPDLRRARGTARRPAASTVGAKSSRSAKQKSASRPQPATRRWRWLTARPSSAVWKRASSVSVAMARSGYGVRAMSDREGVGGCRRRPMSARATSYFAQHCGAVHEHDLAVRIDVVQVATAAALRARAPASPTAAWLGSGSRRSMTCAASSFLRLNSPMVRSSPCGLLTRRPPEHRPIGLRRSRHPDVARRRPAGGRRRPLGPGATACTPPK